MYHRFPCRCFGPEGLLISGPLKRRSELSTLICSQVSNSEIMQTIGGATPLMYACQQCREHEVSDILTKQPYSAKDRDRTLKTPLHYCAENPNTSCAEAVLKVAPELVNAQDENGYCTLHLAVIAGNKPLIKLLIAKGADVNVCDYESHSAVHWAIVSSEKEALEMIIRTGANPSTPDIHGGYPLHYAVQMCGSNSDCIRNSDDTVRVVETLLNFGVDVNVKDKDGRQPILWAASAGSAEAVIHLVSGGACVEAADKDGLTALHCAASRGHTSTLETLITLCGANVDVIDGNGCSALFYAVTLGHADATELLLSLGAEPNRQDRKGRTPAHCGAAKGQLETLRILQKHGGNLWLKNVKGDIPLHEAVASGRKDLVLWLLSQNPEAINLSNNDGRSPLHIASMYNNTEMVKVLLDAKSLVNPVMRTSKGVLMTPLNVALCRGHRSCGKYLQLHGGVPFSKVSSADPFSVIAVRISPSDEMMDQTGEVSMENLTPTPEKTSRSKTSTDVQVIEGETVDKKKVYRRRKKKRSSSNVNDKDSDSDDSIDESVVKMRTSRRNGRNNGNENNYEKEKEDEKKMEIKKAQFVGKGREKSKNTKTPERNKTIKEPQGGRKEEKLEENTAVKKVGKAASEPKPFPRNKSLGEHKNLNNLSPEDFPPLMQTINQLDTVTLEPEIEVSKALSENEVNDNDLSLRIPKVGTSNLSDKDHTRESNQTEKKEEDVISTEMRDTSDQSPLNIQDPPQQDDQPSNDVLNELQENKTIKPEEGRSEKENSKEESLSQKEDKAKKSNGGLRKEDRLTKSSGSRTSTDEGSVRKSEKYVKSSKSSNDARKDEKSQKSGVKSSGSGDSDRGEKTRKTPSPKDAKSGSDAKPSTANSQESLRDKNANSEVAPKDQEKCNSVNNGEETLPPEKQENFEETVDTSASTTAADPEEKSSELVVAEVPHEEVKKIEEVVQTKAAGDTNGKEEPEMTRSKTLENDKPEVVNQEIKPELLESTTEIVPQEQTPNNGGNNPVGTSEERNPNPPKIKTDKNPTEDSQNVASSNVKQEEIREVPEVVTEMRKVAVDSFQRPKIELESSSKKAEVASEILSSALKLPEENPVLIETREVPPQSKLLLEPEPAETRGSIMGNNSLDADQKDNAVGKDNMKPTQKENNPASESNTANEGHNQEDDSKEIKSSQNGETSGAFGNPIDDRSCQRESKDNPTEHRGLRTPRVSRLCHRHGYSKDDFHQISVNQLVQNTIRKYHMERGIFYQLLELKRLQIRAGRANELVLVKRLADEYERSRVFMGMKHFTGLYKFKEFEKFLYDQLKALNNTRSYIIPEVKSYDDIDALSGFLKKTRYKLISDVDPPEAYCTSITQRCHHSACAYTSVPCAAYITNFRRHKLYRPKRECFFPRIEQTSVKHEKQKMDERPATLELIQGSEKHVITLPQNSPDKSKRYYITFTIKGAPNFKEEDFFDNSKNVFKHRHSKSV